MRLKDLSYPYLPDWSNIQATWVSSTINGSFATHDEHQTLNMVPPLGMVVTLHSQVSYGEWMLIYAFSPKLYSIWFNKNCLLWPIDLVWFKFMSDRDCRTRAFGAPFCFILIFGDFSLRIMFDLYPPDFGCWGRASPILYLFALKSWHLLSMTFTKRGSVELDEAPTNTLLWRYAMHVTKWFGRHFFTACARFCGMWPGSLHEIL